MSNIREYYKSQNRTILANIERKGIDIKEVIKVYAEGRAEDHIMMKYRLNRPELSYILTRYATPKIIKERIRNQDLLSGFSFLGGKSDKTDDGYSKKKYAKKEEREEIE